MQIWAFICKMLRKFDFENYNSKSYHVEILIIKIFQNESLL